MWKTYKNLVRLKLIRDFVKIERYRVLRIPKFSSRALTVYPLQ